MLFAMEKILVPATGQPEQRTAAETESRLEISVVFTTVDATLAALKDAGGLAKTLNGRITLLVPQAVPFPLPLESPPVLIEFNEKRFREIASQSPVETAVQIYLCRDPIGTLINVLKPGSVVVVGGRKRWWPTREKSLAHKLRKAGHEVVFKETE